MNEHIFKIYGKRDGEINLSTRKPLKFKVLKNGCYECVDRCLSDCGYPTISINKRRMPAHRHIYEIFKGQIPYGMVVRHKCDNPTCINPEHLMLGTHADNVMDRVDRKRSAIGVRNGRAVLSEKDVIEIRKNMDVTNSEYSRRFGVNRSVIRKIKNNESWRHIKIDG